MIRQVIAAIVLIMSELCTFSQVVVESDSVRYASGFMFREGIYLTFADFRANRPMPFSSVYYPDNREVDFYSALDTVGHISYIDQFGNIKNVATKEIFGFSKNGKPYIYHAGTSSMIPYVGAICHFILRITLQYSSFDDFYYDPFYPYSYYSYAPSLHTYQTEQLKQYVIDMETGKILDYNVENVEQIFAREPKIFDEFSQLKKRKKNKELFYYVRLYNEVRELWFKN